MTGVMFRRELFLPAAVGSLICDVFILWARWPFVAGAPLPSPSVIVGVVLLLLARGWFSLTLCNVALAMLRQRPASIAAQWVPVTTALRIFVVTIALVLPIAIGTLLLIVPGVILLLMWSQVTMLIIDDRAAAFDAPSWSASLTAGYRWQIFVVWLVIWGVSAFVEFAGRQVVSAGGPGSFPEPIAIGASWIWNIVVSSAGIALAAGLYSELVTRAPWERPRSSW